MNLIEHLEELKKRIVISLIFILFASAVSFYYSNEIIEILRRPLAGERLIFLAPAEAFLIRIKIALLGGIVLSLPIICSQIWKFVSPGLKSEEKRYFYLFAPFSFLLFLSGGAFAYFIVLPLGLRFLLNFALPSLEPTLSITKYFSFALFLLFVFALIFELPLAIIFLTKIGIVTPRKLAEKRKYAILAIFVIAAILTPPDIVTQILLALPLIILYEMSVWISKIVKKK